MPCHEEYKTGINRELSTLLHGLAVSCLKAYDRTDIATRYDLLVHLLEAQPLEQSEDLTSGLIPIARDRLLALVKTIDRQEE